MNDHTGPGHGDVTLSLTTATPDGGRIAQSWTICDCTLPALRQRLGPPHHESVADPDAVRATAHAVRDVPGTVHHGDGF